MAKRQGEVVCHVAACFVLPGARARFIRPGKSTYKIRWWRLLVVGCLAIRIGDGKSRGRRVGGVEGRYSASKAQGGDWPRGKPPCACRVGQDQRDGESEVK